MEPHSLAERLAEGAAQLELELNGAVVIRFVEFVALMRKWNRVHNLTALDDEGEILTHHLLDSLSLAPFISGTCCMDIGSGAGLPGIALALCRPDQHWTLVESRAKKAGFLREVKARLRIDNISVIAGRVENYRPGENFDTLVARAVTTLASLLNMTDHLRHPHLRLIAMKGVYPGDELAALTPNQRASTRVVPVEVPGLSAQRHLVVIDGLPRLRP